MHLAEGEVVPTGARQTHPVVAEGVDAVMTRDSVFGVAILGTTPKMPTAQQKTKSVQSVIK